MAAEGDGERHAASEETPGGEGAEPSLEAGGAGDGDHASQASPTRARFESRADVMRAAPKVGPTPAARVRFIADVMACDQWPVYPESIGFREELARHWRVSEKTVRTYSAEAHRALAAEPEDLERIKGHVAARMRRIADAAESTPNMVTGVPDFGSAIKALNDYARYSGIELEQKVRVSGSVSLDDLDALKRKVTGGDPDGGAG